MNRPRAADDFATIRARMEELRRHQEGANPGDNQARQDPPMPQVGEHSLAAVSEQRRAGTGPPVRIGDACRPGSTSWAARATGIGPSERRRDEFDGTRATERTLWKETGPTTDRGGLGEEWRSGRRR
jgi:hypothetical protein